MALLRKDIKVGFLAGGALLAIGAGYMLVLGLVGDAEPKVADAGVDPLGGPVDAIVAEPAGEEFELDSLSASHAAPADDGWGVLRDPLYTETPTANEETTDAVFEEPEPANLNAEIGFRAAEGAGDAAALASNTPEPTTPAEPEAEATIHVVQSGDNFSSIAQQYYGDANLFDAIRRANPDVDPARLKLGQKLTIPNRAAATTVANTPVTTDAATHTVAPGDTLSKIAASRLGRSNLWEQVYELNRDVIGDNPANLKVGMVLELPQ